MNVLLRSILILVLALALGACDRPVAHHFPPDDINVRLDSTNLPIVWIEVGGDAIMRDKRIQARMKIVHNGDGSMNYADTVAHPGQHIDYDGYIALRYRGNSTYNSSPKKPYSLRTLAEPLHHGGKKQKVALLGMGKDNNWALLAPYADKSMIRDMLTYQLARQWMEYVPQGRHCELIVDGVYYGVYILAEVVSKGKYRLNLAAPGDSGDALTGDYLMEVDSNDDVTYTSRYCPVDSSGKPYKGYRILFQYKEPELEELTPVQQAYINGRIDEMENALSRGEDYRRYIDVESFIDYQLMMELGHNVDAYRLSGKFYKRRDSVDPRFKMVIWDTDLAYGNADHRDGWRTDTWMYQNNNTLHLFQEEVYLVPFWWYSLNRDPAYRAQLKARWAAYRNSNMSDERLMATVDSLSTLLTAHGAECRNSQAWPRWGVWVWSNHHVATSYDDEISYIKHWLTRRVAWMDRQLGYRDTNDINR